MASLLFLVSFFFVSLICQSVAAQVEDQVQIALNEAKAQNLANNSIWTSLIHFSDKGPHIRDPQFLLSNQAFSVQRELDLSIRAFYSSKKNQFLCRFPARYFWLKDLVRLPNLDPTTCLELKEFREKAPIDTISVVYASENISRPSSMMGHVFLKLSGVTLIGEEKSYAVSFYTEIKSVNLPKIIYSTLIKGQKGYFSLSPYKEKIKTYLSDEQRNLWEYELTLTPYQRELIALHLYELKQADLTYFFQKYNCATLVSYIVSLVVPDLREDHGIWVTPLDVIKKVDASGISPKKIVLPSSRWSLKMLESQLPSSLNLEVKKTVDNAIGNFPKVDEIDYKYLVNLELRNYNNYRIENKLITRAAWAQQAQEISAATENDDGLQLDLSHYKNPVLAPNDSQWSIGAVAEENKSFIRTSFLPATHLLEDDNRQYFSESSLQLASLSLLTDTRTHHTHVEEFNLYAISSYVPRDIFTGGISGQFGLGVDQQYNDVLQKKSVGYVSGALGYTYAVNRDVDVYGTLGEGCAHRGGENYFYSSATVGVMVREIADMKSMVSLSKNYNELNSAKPLTELQFTQAKYTKQNVAFFIHAKRLWNESKSKNSIDVTVKKYF